MDDSNEMGEKKGALNVEQSRNIRNGSGTTGRHISTDAAINQKKAAQKKSAAAKRRSKKAVNSVKQAAKKPTSKKTSSGKANSAAKRPANRQAPAKQSPNARKQTSNAKKQQNAKRNAQLQNARANGQKKQAARKKKKYKVNYRRLITCIVAALLVFLSLCADVYDGRERSQHHQRHHNQQPVQPFFPRRLSGHSGLGQLRAASAFESSLFHEFYPHRPRGACFLPCMAA